MIRFCHGLLTRARKTIRRRQPSNPSQDYLDCEKFQCAICLDMLTVPVTTPCGHNFCKKCIREHWNTQHEFACPMCREVFFHRPKMSVNILLSEIIAEFRQKAEHKARIMSEQPAAKPGEVTCDLCTETKVKAAKSCLVCMVSYCQFHLEPHLRVPVLKNHQLTEPVKDLEARICPKHGKPLDMFCMSELTFSCTMCIVLDHRTHKVVPLVNYEGQKMEFLKMVAEMQQMIQKRRVKMEEMRENMQKSKAAADRATAVGVEVFTGLKKYFERSLSQLIDGINEEEKATEKLAADTLKDLEEEISDLMKRRSEVEQLFHSVDHRNLSSLKAAPPTKDWTSVSVHPSTYEGTVAKLVAQMEETLSMEIQSKLAEAEKKQEFAAAVTLDPVTAHPVPPV